MSTLMANGFIVTQHTDHNVSISKNGRDIVRLKFSRELSGEELSELAFWAIASPIISAGGILP